MKKTTKNLVIAAVIAAVYAGLTFISNIFGIAYGPIQFRLSEALTILPVFTPAAIPGLCVGCFISNIASFNPVDMLFGTAATFCAAVLSYWLRNVKIFSLPLLSAFVTVLVNAVLVGAEISLFLYNDGALAGYLVSALWVALGELVTAFALGLLLYTAITKNKKAFSFVSENK